MMYKGIVQKGGEYGRRLGFPTANIPLEDANVSGMYAAIVIVEGHEYRAAAYVNQARKLLEAYLLDFDGDLYGNEIEIELLKKLREDQRFETEVEAKETITKDVQLVREYFRIR